MYSWTSRLCAEGRAPENPVTCPSPLQSRHDTKQIALPCLPGLLNVGEHGKEIIGSLLTAEGSEALRGHQEASGHAVPERSSVSRVRCESRLGILAPKRRAQGKGVKSTKVQDVIQVSSHPHRKPGAETPGPASPPVSVPALTLLFVICRLSQDRPYVEK